VADRRAEELPIELSIDFDNATVTVSDRGERRELPFSDPEAFSLVSRAWLRVGWDVKYVYGFSWLGRPVIQLPEDLIRIQETIYRLRPDVVVETGVAHGGSLVFYASLCKAIGKGRVIGIDVEIRPHNRQAIESHELADCIELVEGSSTEPQIVEQVRRSVGDAETVLVLLDSDHTKKHVLAELEAYAPLVTPGSWIVVADGIMEQVVGAPRTRPDWSWNNPKTAVAEFVAGHKEFVVEPPAFPFHEGQVTEMVTYWPGGWVRRLPTS
jgi:cephalosporin hydroxylase